MGVSESKPALVSRPSKETKQKLEPLVRANHRHSLILKDNTPNVITPTLLAASALKLPSQELYKIWDTLSDLTTDLVSERTEEIIESEEMIQTELLHHLGDASKAPAYLNFFDDEAVRLLYNYKAVLQTYLPHDEICTGLLANSGAGMKLLASAIELESCDCVSDALAASAAFYKPLPLPSPAQSPPLSASPETPDQINFDRDELVNRVLYAITAPSADTLNEIVVLHCLSTIHSFFTPRQFRRLWHHQTSLLLSHVAPDNLIDQGHEGRGYALQHENEEGQFLKQQARRFDLEPDEEEEWSGLVREAALSSPRHLIVLRVLKQYPHGLGTAKKMLRHEK